MLRRLLGLIIFLVALVMILILGAGVVYGGQAIDAIGAAVDDVLDITVDTVDNVAATLDQTKATMDEASNGLDTAALLTADLSTTVADTRPLMTSMSTVVTEDVPGSLETIQESIPNIAGVAGVIDSTLITLSEFGVDYTIPIPFNPIEFKFDLGIEYDPEEPFDQTIVDLGDSLDGVPEELRALQGDLDTLSADLEIISTDLDLATADIDAINEQVTLFIPIIDEYLRIVSGVEAQILSAQGQIASQLEMAKMGVTVVLVFLAFSQLAPLYFGWELLIGKRMVRPKDLQVPPAEKPGKLEETAPAEPVVEVEEPEAPTDPVGQAEEPQMPPEEDVVAAAPVEEMASEEPETVIDTDPLDETVIDQGTES